MTGYFIEVKENEAYLSAVPSHNEMHLCCQDLLLMRIISSKNILDDYLGQIIM
jgi:hypothetical protein